MRFHTDENQIIAITSNTDGRMLYSYQTLKPGSFRLKMRDTVSGMVRHLNFKLKKLPDKSIDIKFTCDGFHFNFPLKKNISEFTFSLKDFTLMLRYGITVDENCLTPAQDLDVEF